jgi:hypothetical protein
MRVEQERVLDALLRRNTFELDPEPRSHEARVIRPRSLPADRVRVRPGGVQDEELCAARIGKPAKGDERSGLRDARRRIRIEGAVRVERV